MGPRIFFGVKRGLAGCPTRRVYAWGFISRGRKQSGYRLRTCNNEIKIPTRGPDAWGTRLYQTGQKTHRLKPVLLLLRNDRQQYIRLAIFFGVQRGLARKKFCRAVGGIVVQKRAAAAKFIFEV